MEDNNNEYGQDFMYEKLYGSSFAEKVIKKVREKGAMNYSHRDYCGIGLFYNGIEFIFSQVYDSMQYRGEPIITFKHEEEAIEFLGGQSDYSMSGLDKESVFREGRDWYQKNQRITRKMMQRFINDSLHK